MDFAEKLRRASNGLNKSRAAREVGLKENTFSSYIAAKSIPRADIAFKIAKALNVPLDWLVDDTRDWPPPEGDPQRVSPTMLSDKSLISELLRRRRLNQIALIEALEVMQQFDWANVRQRIAKIPPGSEVPADLRALAGAVSAASLATMQLKHWLNLEWQEVNLQDELPLDGHDDEDLDVTLLADRFQLTQQNPDYDRATHELKERVPSMVLFKFAPP